MKGPGHRNRFDVRRVWECPVCGRRVLTGGRIVHLECTCSSKDAPKRTWMRLVEGILAPAVEAPAVEAPADGASPQASEEAASRVTTPPADVPDFSGNSPPPV
jgi:hypothetical protein